MRNCMVGAIGFFVLFGMAGCDTGPGSASCVSNDDCVKGYLCDDDLCIKRDPVTIVTGELPGATEYAPYTFTLEAADGIPPYSWELIASPDWLEINPETGELSGDAGQMASGLVVAVKVSDSTEGRDSYAEAEFDLDVEVCFEGQQADCYEAEDGVCMRGVKLCSSGQWGPCSDLEFSEEMDHCGPDCGGCDELTADHCQQGACACGAGSACAAGQGCCDSNCLDVSDDPMNCGGCGVICGDILLNAEGIQCIEGSCVFDNCSRMFLDCNSDLADGCETAMSVAQCGSCGRDCNEITQNVEEIECVDNGDLANCGYQGYGIDGEGCVFGFLDCDDDRANGCETAVSNDDCGACLLECQTECLVHSDTGEYYCGCDDDLDCGDNARCCSGECVLLTDSQHCGSCGHDCADQMLHATGLFCNEGLCDYTQCEESYLDCDGNRQNGCATLESVQNCGGCGQDCGDNAICQEHACACVADWGNCDDGWSNGCETDLLATTVHCGNCDTDCNTEILNADSGIRCRNGLCDYTTCTVGFDDCDSNRSNGCEEDIWETTNCGTDCSDTVNCNDAVLNASGPFCPEGHCNFESCLAGWESCDSDPTDGCETDIWSTSHCGTNCQNPVDCNVTVLHASGRLCDHGACGYSGSCNQGWDNCDGDDTDGCETNIWTTANCGQSCASAVNCGTQVEHADGKTCDSGNCDYSSCDPGFMNCNDDRTDGCEKSIWLVTSCGNVCDDAGRQDCTIQVANVDQPICDGGSCSYWNCSTHYGDCDSNPANGCETYLQDNESHCGYCDIECIASGGTNPCINGTCQPNCDTNRGDCDDDPTNGCETNTFGNMDHCGECGNKCVAPYVCDTTDCIIP